MKVKAIFGPPGTGKTRTLIEMAAQDPTIRSVFLSFTKAAAQEALNRAPALKASTIHSMAYGKMSLHPASVVNPRKLQAFGDATGIPFADTTSEAEEGDKYVAVLSYGINQMIEPMEAYDRFGRPGTPQKFENFLQSYNSWKSTYGYADFNDMLIHAMTATYSRIDHLYLDEAQDCSPLQWKVFTHIASFAKDVTIAGDDDQAIFEWSGADPHGMIDFTTANNGKIEVLGRSWRVPKTAHDLAHDHVLAAIDKRVGKKFDPAQRDGEIIGYGGMDDVDYKKLIGKDVMILVRDRFRLREAQKALHADYVPYTIEGGASPYQNIYAEALRGWQRQGGLPLESEMQAMVKVSAHPGKTWSELAAMPWRDAFSIPARLSEFYDSADLWADATVRLSTIHKAKGMEADAVVVDLALSGQAEEALYNKRDAEARVLYVALTRNRHTLSLCGDHPLLAGAKL